MENKKWLNYWKKSLSDSVVIDIEIEKHQHFEIKDFKMESLEKLDVWKVNNLIDFEEGRVNKKKGNISKESKEWIQLEEIQIVIAPMAIDPMEQNRASLRNKKQVFPFWYYAKINRAGELQIPEESFPIFQRKNLEPLIDDRTEFVLSSVDSVEKSITTQKNEFENYSQYIRFVKEVFRAATNQEIETYSVARYESIKNAIVLLPNEEIGAAISIIQLYEKIIEEKKIPKLLGSLIGLSNEKKNTPLSVPEFIEKNSLHLGQMGADFPLSFSQRKSLYTFINANDPIFAVNGPPGTGKTTLILSVVANEYVERAIKGMEAPIILACSTNNQAVTNIIDSFSKSNTGTDKLHGRWLPDVEGYATYLPSTGKTEVELNNINYKKLDGKGLFEKIENSEYLKRAKKQYTERAAVYFGFSLNSITEFTQKLRKEIIKIQTIISDASLTWSKYLEAEKIFQATYIPKGFNSSKYYENGFLKEDTFEADIKNTKVLESAIIKFFNNESLVRRLLCFFGFKSALNNRVAELKILIRDSESDLILDINFTKISILEKAHKKISLAKKIISAIENWKEWQEQNYIFGNPPQSKEGYPIFESQKMKSKLNPNCIYDDIDILLRNRAFKLAVHYWEGEYLIQLEKDLSNPNFEKKGKENTKNRWSRQAMLTPCFVSTFYMAPKYFSYYSFIKNDDNGKNEFDNIPLFDFIDLLIVDEAGQVSPEIGVATFALAKQALVVGDVYQIEPVWNMSVKQDMDNLRKFKLVKSDKDLIYYKEFEPKGFLSSSGSIMKMAQNASNFKENGAAEKGVILVEHRRCYDEIINYCNVLAYNGQLVPLKGKAKNDLLFPPMYCIHVDGNSTSLNGSRYNLGEVNAIVNWLSQNRGAIESKYGKLEQAVGIITPFVGQKNSLRDALKSAGFDIDTLKLGTVHALQGAERAIIIFSMVYGKGDSATMFFDRDNKPNMLNVAVSRAKENFVVFANTEILDKESKTPSGLLANYLVYEKDFANI